MVWLGRRHLAFAVANCVLNLRFAVALLDAAVTAGSCDGKCSFYFNCYFFRTTPTNRDLREKSVYFPSRLSAGCAPASLTGVESVEKSSEQEIISQEQSQNIYEDHSNDS